MAILGMRGSGSFNVGGAGGERPESWRQIAFRLNPNGKYPLNAILSMMEGEELNDTIFHWFEEDIHLQRVVISAVVAAGTINIPLVSGANNFKKGDILLEEETGEQMRVKADPTSDTSISVTRHFYGQTGDTGFLVSGTAITSGDHLVAIGTAYGENAPMPNAISYQPSLFTNYAQNFRDTAELTLIASRVRLRNTKNAWGKLKRDALDIHMTKMEKAFIWGQQTITTDSNGKAMYTTQGILNSITTNKFKTAAGALSGAGLDTFLESIFSYGGTEKLVFCGARALNVLNQIAKDKLTINSVPTDQVYGMNMVQIISPFGTLYLKLHPLMALSSTWTNNLIVIQPEYLNYRFLFDTEFKRSTASGGTHAKLGEYYNVSGLELHGEKAFGYLNNITSYSATASNIVSA